MADDGETGVMFKKRRSQRASSKSMKVPDSSALCSQCRQVPLPGHKAAYLGHLECLQALCGDAPGKLQMRDRNGAAPLHLAARQCHREAVEWLLQNFPDQCRAQASGGETPMLIAAAQGSKECLSILASATPSSRQEIIRDTDVNGLSSVHLASLFDRGSCVKWLLKHFGHRLVVLQSQSGITPVHIAGATGHLSVMQQLLKANKKGAVMEDASGAAPAYFAAQEGKLNCFKYLIQRYKVDALAKCDDGMTSVHAAAQGGHLDILMFLVEVLGEDVLLTPTDDKGSPIHFAAAMGHHEVLEWMLSFKSLKGAVHLSDSDLGTPAHDAADNSQVTCLRILKNNGANMGAKDKDGATPISLALESDDPECRKWAVEERKLLDPAKRPSRMEADALATLELTKLATDGKKHILPGVMEQTSPIAEEVPPLSEASSPPVKADNKDNDVYAVPQKSRAQKKQWDGSGPARLPEQKAEQAAENALAAATETPVSAADDGSDESDHEEKESVPKTLSIGPPLMGSTPVKSMDRSISASSTGPDLPPRTEMSHEMENIDETDGPSTNANAGSEGRQEIVSNGHETSPLTLSPHTATPIRPKSASVIKPPVVAAKDLSRSNSDPPTPSKLIFDKSGKPINTNYPRLTGRQGRFDSPHDSPHASPAGSPAGSPLILRKPFNFAAKPPSSPTVARAHSLPKTPTNDKADMAASVKKTHSLKMGDPSERQFVKQSEVANFLNEDSDDDLN